MAYNGFSTTITTSSADEDITAALRALSVYNGEEDSISPFRIIKLDLSTDSSTNVTINDVNVFTTRLAGTRYVFNTDVGEILIKKIEIAENGVECQISLLYS